MPVNYTVSEDGGYVHAKAIGLVKASEIISYQEELKKDSRIKGNVKVVFDTQSVTGSEITNQQILEIANIVVSNENRSHLNKLAIVVDGRDARQKAEQYAKAMPPAKQTVQVFNDLLIAKSWLGMDQL